jgi:formylglycine-generating enzyme required for sulfatase activity
MKRSVLILCLLLALGPALAQEPPVVQNKTPAMREAERAKEAAAREKASGDAARAALDKQKREAARLKTESDQLRAELEALKRQQAAEQKANIPSSVTPSPSVKASSARLPAAGSGESFRDAFKDGSGSGPELVFIPAGRFQMGSNEEASDEKPPHPVTISKPFALGKYEVTQGEWKAVMGSAPPELRFKDCGERCPVENVSWNDIQDFIQKLNEKTGQQYRLPSESEWEYACRAGGTEKYCGSNDVDAVGWYGKNSDSKTHPVGQKAKNAWGLYDMSGNVREWVEDCYIDNYRDGPKDEKARGDHNDKSCSRVLRGGSWFNFPGGMRSASRGGRTPSIRLYDIGFRIARTLP